MESGNGGINGKSAKIITIGAGVIDGKYISFPKSSLKGNYYNLLNKYIYFSKIFMYHMTCDHVTNLVISDWLNQVVATYQSTVADWLTQKEVANHSKYTIDSYWTIN